jgi:Rieske Fe-S protein
MGGEVVALSNTCPHLGCKVHWEIRNQRFFCPCHQGVFDSDGVATAGPPAAEGKNLKKFSIRRIGNNLFLEVEEIVSL